MTKSKPVKESTVVKNIIKALDNNYPGFYYKSHGGMYQVVGLPDIIGLHKGRFIGVEVKSPGKEKNLTLKQQQIINKINQAGGIAFMATTPEQVLTKLKGEFKNENTKRKKSKTHANM